MVQLIFAKATLKNMNSDQCFKMLYDFDVRSQWDGIFSEYEVVEKQSDCQDIIYMVIKAPWGITNRDFLQKRTFAKDYKGYDYIMHHTHTEHPRKPNRSNHIRAYTIVSGYLFTKNKENPNDTDVVIVAQTDVKGMIPVAIVNYNTARGPKKWCNDFQKKGAKLKKKGVI